MLGVSFGVLAASSESLGDTITVVIPASTTSGTSFTTTVTVKDAAGVIDIGYTGTVHFSSTDGSATLPSNSTLTAGVGTFSTTLATAGVQTVTATDTVTSSITGNTTTTVTAAAVLPQDNFTDTNGVLLQNHTMTAGTGWTKLSGGGSPNGLAWNTSIDLQIQSNSVPKATGTAGCIGYTTPGTTANITSSIVVNFGIVNGTRSIVELLLRVQDSGNYWYAEVDPNAQTLQIIQVTSNIRASRASASTIGLSASTNYTFTFKADNSNVLTATINGHSCNFTSSAFSASTAIGIGMNPTNNGGSGTVTLDTFTTTSP